MQQKRALSTYPGNYKTHHDYGQRRKRKKSESRAPRGRPAIERGKKHHVQVRNKRPRTPALEVTGGRVLAHGD